MTDLARREGGALSQIVGTGDTRAALAVLEQNVRDIIDVARARGFVKSYGENNPHEHFGLPAWQLLGMTYGVTPVIVPGTLEPDDDGFKVYAEARTLEGIVVGGDYGMCHRSEPGKQRKSKHDISAMASVRAKRNALRSAFGAALVLAGFDFPDPDAPATNDQVGVLHQLERELGWSHDNGHEVAGVESYKDLNREDASELIDQWTKLRDDIQSVKDRGMGPTPHPSESGGESGREASGEASDPAPQCSHPSWKRREGVLRCTECDIPKNEVQTPKPLEA